MTYELVEIVVLDTVDLGDLAPDAYFNRLAIILPDWVPVEDYELDDLFNCDVI